MALPRFGVLRGVTLPVVHHMPVRLLEPTCLAAYGRPHTAPLPCSEIPRAFYSAWMERRYNSSLLSALRSWVDQKASEITSALVLLLLAEEVEEEVVSLCRAGSAVFLHMICC